MLGAAQTQSLTYGLTLTTSTPTVLTTDTSVAGINNQLILSNNSAFYFKGSVIAGVTGGGNTKAWTFEGVAKRGANAAATSIVGTVAVNVVAADAGASTWTISVTADTTNGGVAITVTGTATTIRWAAEVKSTQIGY